jgi:hypothetical protein
MHSIPLRTHIFISKHVKHKADLTNHMAKHLLTAHKLSEHGPIAKDGELTLSRLDFEQFKKLLI